MIYMCIMGNGREYAEEIIDKLSHMGYHKNTVWSTRKTSVTEVLSETSYESNIKSDKMIHLDEVDNIKYGVLKPIGYKQYVSGVTPKQFSELCKVYKNQVIGFYIVRKEPHEECALDSETKEYLSNNHGVIIVCNTTVDSSCMTAEILRYIKKLPCS